MRISEIDSAHREIRPQAKNCNVKYCLTRS